jgi:hypothetical protein
MEHIKDMKQRKMCLWPSMFVRLFGEVVINIFLNFNFFIEVGVTNYTSQCLHSFS